MCSYVVGISLTPASPACPVGSSQHYHWSRGWGFLNSVIEDNGAVQNRGADAVA